MFHPVLSGLRLLKLALFGIFTFWAFSALAQIETLYVVPLSHTDVGFTAPPNDVAERMKKNGEDALSEARRNPHYVWNFEVFWQFEQWLNSHSDAEELQQMLSLVKQGRFGIGAAYVNAHTSLMSAWGLDQLYRVPTTWAKEQGIPLDWAIIDDVPGHTIDMQEFMAKNGVKYLACGVNQSLTKALPEEVSNTPFWWEGPDGSRILLWISAKDAYTEAYMRYGIDPQTARFFNSKEFNQKKPLDIMKHGIDQAMKYYDKKKYPYDSVLVLHGFDNWDTSSSKRLPEAMRLWNEQGGKPRIVISTPRAFFQHIEEKYGPQLEVRRGGFGGQWEGVKNQVPSLLARARNEEELLKTTPNPDRHEIEKVLTIWDHNVAMGSPWPDMMTKEQTIDHDRQMFDLAKDWPPPNPLPAGEIIDPPRTNFRGVFQTNHLFLLTDRFFTKSFKPIPKEAWPLGQTEKMPDGSLRLRHRIDRKKLPDDTSVAWVWKLREGEQEAPVVVKTAAATMKIPDDGLAGYTIDHWIAPEQFQIGSTTFRPHGPFMFYRMDRYPGWLISTVLQQGLDAEFKGKKKGTLTFEEAYPGEESVWEFTIDVKEE